MTMTKAPGSTVQRMVANGLNLLNIEVETNWSTDDITALALEEGYEYDARTSRFRRAGTAHRPDVVPPRPGPSQPMDSVSYPQTDTGAVTATSTICEDGITPDAPAPVSPTPPPIECDHCAKPMVGGTVGGGLDSAYWCADHGPDVDGGYWSPDPPAPVTLTLADCTCPDDDVSVTKGCPIHWAAGTVTASLTATANKVKLTATANSLDPLGSLTAVNGVVSRAFGTTDPAALISAGHAHTDPTITALAHEADTALRALTAALVEHAQRDEALAEVARLEQLLTEARERAGLVALGGGCTDAVA